MIEADTETQQDRPIARPNHSPNPSSPVGGKAPAKPRFSWTLVNFWLDGLLLINFLSLCWVSLIVRFVFPSALAAQGWSLWGWNLDRWLGLQFALVATLAFGILIHLMLHWSWVCGVFFSRIWRKHPPVKLPDDGTRTIYGVGLMIVILNVMGLLVALAALGVSRAT